MLANVNARNKFFGLRNFSDTAKKVIIPLKEASTKRQEIDLKTTIKEFIPIRNKIERFLLTRGRWVKKLETEINNLEKYKIKGRSFGMSCRRCHDIHSAQLNGKSNLPCKCSCHSDLNPQRQPDIHFGPRPLQKQELRRI